jgi:tetratricopeptide (TPR) repeat protein
MKDHYDKTKTASEVNLWETADDNQQPQPIGPAEVIGASSDSSMLQVRPPRRDGKKDDSEKDSQKPSVTRLFGIFALLSTFVLAAAVIINLSFLEGLYYCGMGLYDTKNNNLTSAVKNYERAFGANPNDANPLFLAAAIHLANKEDKLAFSEFETAITKAPNPSFAYNHRAKILNGMGRKNDAIKDWTKAIELKPHYFAAHAMRGYAYLDLNNWAAALSDFDEALAVNPKEAEIMSNKAYCLSKLGRYAEALTVIRQALAIDPTNSTMQDEKRNYQSKLGIDSTD